MVASYARHPILCGCYDAGLWAWVERQTVLSQVGLPTSKREEFPQSDGTGLRDVVYGVGARETYHWGRVIGSSNEQRPTAETHLPSPYDFLLFMLS